MIDQVTNSFGTPVKPDTVARQAGLLTTGEAQRLLGVARLYLWRLVQLGKISRPISVYSGRTRLWKEDELRAYKATHPHLGERRKSVTESPVAGPAEQ